MDNNSTLINSLLPLKGVNTYIKNIFLIIVWNIVVNSFFENTSSFLASADDYANFCSFNYCNGSMVGNYLS